IEMASYLGPPLTTVSQPIDAMTAQGMEMLLAEANGDHLAQRRVEMVPQLVIRRSTRPAPGRAQGGRAD
ncbi:MAG: substrate-binding domain-containing protein, partial [Bacillota bacterium]